MVKVASAVLAATALVGSVAAVNCNSGEIYCGSRLIATDSSNLAAVDAALKADFISVNDNHEKNSLFLCPPAVSGLSLIYLVSCNNGCAVGGGKKGGDTCWPA